MRNENHQRRWLTSTLHLELRSVTCNGAEENHAHRCDPYDLRVQEQPLFLVCSSITIFTSIILDLILRAFNNFSRVLRPWV